MIASFYDTRSNFRTFINYTKPLSYDQWMTLPEDHKAAALFVEFFNEIMLAWSKAQGTFRGDDEEAVETVIQYLIKNTAKIEDDSKRYRAPYIYKVAYNALYCIVHDRLRDKQRREYEVDPIVVSGDGQEVNIVDFIVRDNSAEDEYVNSITSTKFRGFWEAVESVDNAQDVVNKIFEKGYDPNKFSARENEIVAQIKIKIKSYND